MSLMPADKNKQPVRVPSVAETLASARAKKAETQESQKAAATDAPAPAAPTEPPAPPPPAAQPTEPAPTEPPKPPEPKPAEDPAKPDVKVARAERASRQLADARRMAEAAKRVEADSKSKDQLIASLKADLAGRTAVPADISAKLQELADIKERLAIAKAGDPTIVLDLAGINFETLAKSVADGGTSAATREAIRIALRSADENKARAAELARRDADAKAAAEKAEADRKQAETRAEIERLTTELTAEAKDVIAAGGDETKVIRKKGNAGVSDLFNSVSEFCAKSGRRPTKVEMKKMAVALEDFYRADYRAMREALGDDVTPPAKTEPAKPAATATQPKPPAATQPAPAPAAAPQIKTLGFGTRAEPPSPMESIRAARKATGGFSYEKTTNH